MSPLAALSTRRRPSPVPIDPYLLSDSFTRADSSITAGSTDSYVGGVSQAWTPSGSTVWGIASNQLKSVTGAADGYLTADSGATSHEYRATLAALPTSINAGIVAGFTDTNNFILFQTNSAGNGQMFKRVSGTFTAIGGATLANGTFHAGDEIGIRIESTPTPVKDGALIQFLKNGAVVATASVTSFTAGTKVGFRVDGTNASLRWDNVKTARITARATWARSATAVLSPSFAELAAYNPDVKWIDGQWVMNYSPNSPALGTALAYSSDLINWTKEAANPILSPIAGEVMATNGSLVKKGSTYYLWYQDGNAPCQVRLATATALAGPWTRQGVVLPAGGGDSQTADPFVRLMADGVTFEIYYTATSICRATSTDGVTWTKTGTVLATPTFQPINYGEPFVITDPANNDLHMFFCGGVTNGYRSIHEAVSTDSGATWTVRPYRLTKGATGQFDDLQVFDPCPVLVGNALYLFYAGSQAVGGGGGFAASVGLAIIPFNGRTY